MNTAENKSYKIFEDLRALGYVAGVTIKGRWVNQANIYRYIQREIIPSDFRLVIPTQVHGARIRHIMGNETVSGFESDGVITKLEKTCLTVTTADCLPLLAFDQVSGYFAAIHVGWRSFVAGIIDNFFALARELGMDIKSTSIITGPSIGPCCFAIGPDVAALFDESNIEYRDGHLFVDLRRAIKSQALLRGIKEANYGGLDDCTSCDAEQYYSYRRDKISPIQLVTFIYKTNK
jgi:hypothetical protein